MSRRKSDGEQEFGSDSFLDIIANIVGILIILIVVAGVKVARQADQRDLVVTELADVMHELPEPISDDALPTDSVATEWPWQTQSQPTRDDASVVTKQQIEEAEQTRQRLTDEQQTLQIQIGQIAESITEAQNEQKRLTAQLVAQQQDLKLNEQAVADAQLTFASLTSDVAEQTRQQRNLVDELQQVNQARQSYAATLGTLTERQKFVTVALAEITAETHQLNEVLEQNNQQVNATDRLQHRLSPVSRSVAKDELHFRLASGRIAQVPLKDLLERLKDQVSSRRNLVMKFQQYNGAVGPVGGFRMEYIVQRQQLSPLQALQAGQSGIRLAVRKWEILPTSDLVAETVDDALALGSRFRQVLERTYPETAITIWLYPDDFQHFHRLREFAHQLGLRVAARPLPDGTPIAGSPNGSQSSSQ